MHACPLFLIKPFICGKIMICLSKRVVEVVLMNKLRFLLFGVLFVVTSILGFFAGAFYMAFFSRELDLVLFNLGIGNFGLVVSLIVPFILCAFIVYKDEKHKKDNFPHVCMYGFIAGFVVGLLLMFPLMMGVGTP